MRSGGTEAPPLTAIGTRTGRAVNAGLLLPALTRPWAGFPPPL